jgi:hypothetical protein
MITLFIESNEKLAIKKIEFDLESWKIWIRISCTSSSNLIHNYKLKVEKFRIRISCTSSSNLIHNYKLKVEKFESEFHAQVQAIWFTITNWKSKNVNQNFMHKFKQFDSQLQIKSRKISNQNFMHKFKQFDSQLQKLFGDILHIFKWFKFL